MSVGDTDNSASTVPVFPKRPMALMSDSVWHWGCGVSGEFLIYFDGVMWIGLFSVEKNGRILRIGKFIFGSEPSSAEVYDWLRKGAPGLLMRDMSESETLVVKERVKNPKRVLREVRKSLSQTKESHAQKCMREDR